ncbi:hypothetical protein HMPREF2955_13055 [Prevotella sp. HMSC073D09]|nr:hypothetical protein HMPREF2955_13055 [Prevotella sp. HMSC073D09]
MGHCGFKVGLTTCFLQTEKSVVSLLFLSFCAQMVQTNHRKREQTSTKTTLVSLRMAGKDMRKRRGNNRQKTTPRVRNKSMASRRCKA